MGEIPLRLGTTALDQCTQLHAHLLRITERCNSHYLDFVIMLFYVEKHGNKI